MRNFISAIIGAALCVGYAMLLVGYVALFAGCLVESLVRTAILGQSARRQMR